MLTTAALFAGGTVLFLFAGPSASADASPAPSNAGQLITVNAATSSSTTATLTAWSRGSDGIWRIAIGPVSAYVGSEGIGKAAEGSGRTPAGTYSLTQAFGRLPNPGTRIAYFKTDTLDWWDENSNSPTYNEHVRRASSPGGASENLYNSGSVYDYAVNMNYNLARTPGAGSAFFLHVTDGQPTAGCVAVPRATMVAILKWLDPAQHPYIYTKVGAAWKPPAPTHPVGQVQVLAPIGSKQINVSGWAVNPAAPTTAMKIRVRVFGPGGWKFTYDTTRVARPDIASMYWWAGPKSGFHIHVASTVGVKVVCVDEVTISSGAVRNLTCHHITFR